MLATSGIGLALSPGFSTTDTPAAPCVQAALSRRLLWAPGGGWHSPGGHQVRETTARSSVLTRCPVAVNRGGSAWSSARAGSTGLCQRRRLHQRCANAQLLRSYGDPPSATGTSSSTSGEPGSPCGRARSTGCPHRWQWVSSRSTRRRTRSRAAPLLRLGLVTPSRLRLLLRDAGGARPAAGEAAGSGAHGAGWSSAWQRRTPRNHHSVMVVMLTPCLGAGG